MKTSVIFKTGFSLIVALGLTFNSHASNEPTASTVDSFDESAAQSMNINVPATMNTYVSLLDQEGDMIYSDFVVKDDNAGKTYDFSDVENGIYTFITYSDHKKLEKTFMVENNELLTIKEDISYRPVFWMDGDILSVNYLNLSKDNVYISLEDESLLLFEDYSDEDMSYGKILDLTNLSPGEYSITLKAGGETYNYFFAK